MSSKRRLNLRASHPTSSINIAYLVETLKDSIETISGRRVLKLYKVFKFINNEAHILKKGLFLHNNGNSDEIDDKTELRYDVKLLTLSSDKSTDGIKIEVYNHPQIKYNGYESIEPTERIVDGIGISRVYREEQSQIEIPKYIDENKLQRPLMVLNETNHYNYLLTNKEQTVIYYIKIIKPLYKKLQKILKIDVIDIIDVDPSSLSLSTSGGKNLNIKKVRKLKSYLK